MTLRLHRAARSELRRAIVWYEERRPTLGAILHAAAKQSFAEIEAAPRRWPKWALEPRVRRRVLERFPFAVVYLVVGEVIFVVAFAHTRRSARYRLGRLAGTVNRSRRRSTVGKLVATVRAR